MALLLNEIKWDEPILPSVPDAAWEAEVKRRGGHCFELDRRIAPSRWLREACFGAASYHPSEISERLFRIGLMVTAQENACRYCYGAHRAYMKVLGYSETFIQGVERDVRMAEIDDKERAYIAFCRNLARSRPRPSGAARDRLLVLGYSRPEINEMAFVISIGCFYNRLGTLIACPPEQRFERMANGPIGRMMGLLTPLQRALAFGKHQAQGSSAPLDAAALAAGRFGPILAPLAGLPAANVMKSALDGAFESDVLDQTTKALMFAVIARTLGCPYCEREAPKLLNSSGMSSVELEAALATLQSNRLRPHESGLLSWARDTVYYETSEIQRKTRVLAATLGNSAAFGSHRRRFAGECDRTVGDASGVEDLIWALTALGTLVLLGIGTLVFRERKRSRRLERLLVAADDKLEHLQRQFERFVPPDVVERLTDVSDVLSPERRHVTILFADLRGFTAMCDRLDPAVTVAILNDYFRHMIQAISRHHGHVTELVGDGLLALFGALEVNPWQGRDSVLAAQEMRAELRPTTRNYAGTVCLSCDSASAFTAARSWRA